LDKQIVDYIVVGAGSAGCVIAHRLVKAGCSVLLLEAGPTDAVKFVKMPATFVRVIGTERSWVYETTPQPHANGRKMYVPQGRMIFPYLTVEENIITGMENARDEIVPPYVYETFPVLFEMRKRRGGNLSGGQQQQLAIARALVSNPKVLLLDEPTEGIQPSIIKDIARALNRLKAQLHFSMLVSEQVLSFAMEVADRFLILERGEFAYESRKADIDTARVHAYLTV